LENIKVASSIVNQNCPNAENIAQLDSPVVKFSMTLPEHSFHADKED
jgi:hypothetical protein